MNEPSNFLEGSTKGCPATSLENPPYTPGRDLSNARLRCRCSDVILLFLSQESSEILWNPKLCVSARSRNCPRTITCTASTAWWKLKPPPGKCQSQPLHLLSFQLNNLWLLLSSALKRIIPKRPFVISRSTFPSQGMYSGHWLGDNKSRWKDLYTSIAGWVVILEVCDY